MDLEGLRHQLVKCGHSVGVHVVSRPIEKAKLVRRGDTNKLKPIGVMTHLIRENHRNI